MVTLISPALIQGNGVTGQKRKAIETLTAERRKITRACDSCKVYLSTPHKFSSTPETASFPLRKVLALTLSVGRKQDAPGHYHVIVASSCREHANIMQHIPEELHRPRCPLRALHIAKMLYDVRRLQFDRPFLEALCLRDQRSRLQVRRDPSCVRTHSHLPSCHRGTVHPSQRPRTWRVTI